MQFKKEETKYVCCNYYNCTPDKRIRRLFDLSRRSERRRSGGEGVVDRGRLGDDVRHLEVLPEGAADAPSVHQICMYHLTTFHKAWVLILEENHWLQFWLGKWLALIFLTVKKI